MRTKTKALALALCAVLLVVTTVFVTMAFLTSKDTVTNTFTVGKVTITLDEADVKSDGTYESNKEARVDTNEYKLIPGHTYIKDPTIHVADDSEECWLFVKVENGLANAEVEGATSIASQMAAKGWTKVDGTDVYAYATKQVAGADVVVFDNFKIAGTTDVSLYEDAEIVVTAYAIQADGFATAAAAWADAGAEAQAN
jgi:predicted ribosomally synthesized peptide with SipW-like signal peptide